MLTLSPELQRYASSWAKNDGIEFDVLLDLGLGVARDYGLAFSLPDDLIVAYREGMNLDLTRFNGDESWQLPVPATFVIAQDGTIVYAAADADYTTRPEPSEAVAAIP